MESKPFSIQSPEQIAKDYGGNKQKIAEAMQMGVVDPTAGTLAGMFIDRMRSAAQQEQAPQQTVAQQVFAPPAPAAPMGGIGMPAPPPPAPTEGAPAGLGATPEAAQMQAPMPEMPAPEMPMEEAPMRMAMGGLTSLPLPDTMFDEPDNGGYADGGIVAFAGAGQVTDPLAWMRSSVTSPYGKRAAGMHEGLDFGVGKRTPIGAPAPGKVIKAGKDDINGNFVRVLHPDGTSSSYSHLNEITVNEGDEVGPGQVLGLSGNTGRVRGANGGYHLHFGARDAQGNRINPEDFFRGVGPQVASGKWQQKVPERDTSTAQGRAMSAEDAIALTQRQLDKLPREQLERAKTAALEELDPDKIEKDRKYDMYSALASFGLSLASPDNYRGEGILGSIAKAAKATMPEFEASRKERKAAKNEAVRSLMALEDVDRKTAIAGVELGMDVYKTGLSEDRAERALAFQQKELISRITQAGLDREAAYKLATLKTSNPTEFESMMAITMNGTPEQKAALSQVMKMKNPSASGGDAADRTRQLLEGRGGTAEGTTAKDSDGKTIVFSNGQWVYP